jgi:GxxExxY protein
LRPGLLEFAYEHCLAHELGVLDLRSNVSGPWRSSTRARSSNAATGSTSSSSDALVVEIKCVDRLRPIHKAQLLTHLRFTKLQTGLLVNFRGTVL